MDNDNLENEVLEQQLIEAQKLRNEKLAAGAIPLTAPIIRRFDKNQSNNNNNNKLSVIVDTNVTLSVSPFKGRKPTIIFFPLDRPWDGDLCKNDLNAYVEPTSLTYLHQNRKNILTITGNCKSISRSGPYTSLRFIISKNAVRFSALMCTLERAGFIEEKSLLSNNWSLKWCKHPVRSDFTRIKSFQKVNHFPGTWRIGKKDELHKHILAARERWNNNNNNIKEKEENISFGDFFPMGWVLPEEQEILENLLQFPEEYGNIFIVKPTTSACGRGIYLLEANKNCKISGNSVKQEEEKDSFNNNNNNNNNNNIKNNVRPHRFLVQRYISDPMLIEGYKFDLRLYIVVTSYTPLRVFIYNEGLVRFATSPYPNINNNNIINNTSDLTAHLTNFTINKKSEDFIQPNSLDDIEGVTSASKWTLASLKEHFIKNDLNWEGTMEQIHDVIIKVLLAVEPHVNKEIKELENNNNNNNNNNLNNCCFEIYGVDILLRQPYPPHDITPKPVIMEVNIMPSLSTHYSLLDHCVKGNFIADMLTLIGISASPSILKRKIPSQQNENNNINNNNNNSEINSSIISYDHPFLDSLTDKRELEACLIAEEELLRCVNFNRLCPTPDSYKQYEALFISNDININNNKEDEINCNDNNNNYMSSEEKERYTLNKVLSAWEEAKVKNPPKWGIRNFEL